MKLANFKKVTGAIAAVGLAALCSTVVNAQTLSSNSTGTNNGFYYSFWKDSGSASMTLYGGGRYSSQWTNNTNNWVGGKGWNPGSNSKVVSYSGYYGGSNSQNTYVALYGWTRSPLIEYYVIESYGSYNPASCSGGTDYGSFQSDGATYNVRRCTRTQQPSIDGTQTFYQYFSVRNPKKGFGNISGTVTFANHANFWASKGLNLGQHNYMILATEGYQSSGNSDLTISEGSTNNNNNSTSSSSSSGTNSSASNSTGTGTGTGGSGITVRARGIAGGEHIYLKVGGANVASWNLTTSYQTFVYSGTASGDINVEYDNDTSGRDVQVDYIQVNGETRQAEEMTYNTGLYANGSCGGGGNSEMMHCNGVIGFGDTTDCFSGSCGSGTGTGNNNNSSSSSSGNNNNNNNNNNTNNCAGYVGITFDDGPNGNTTTLINILKQNGLTPVTWFNQGNNVASNGSLVSQERSVGEVQNHSYSHSHMTSWSYSQVLDELNRTNQAIQNTGAPKPTLFRPPYGETNSTISQAASAAGLKVVTWDVDSQDWNGASATAIANANNQLQNGQIILMHDGSYTNTNAAISQIAANLKAKRLCPGRIDPSTGRAVAPSSSGTSSTSSSSANNNNNNSSISSSSSSSSNNNSGSGSCKCNWWGTVYPSCTNTSSGWGWENNQSCISNSTCGTQGQGGGGLVCN
jgi:peptidoglycan-N-acetylglucosamine deacetylase